MSGETQQFLSRSEFAAQQGWSPSYVTKLGKQERLVFDQSGKKIDVAATLAMLQRTSDPGKEAVRDHHAAARVEKHVTSHTSPTAPLSEPKATDQDPKYWGNKTRREGALAELAELELAKKRGDLVERAHVESMAYAAGRALRDIVLGLPTKLAPQFANMTDPYEIEVKLRNALRQVFVDAQQMTADDLLRATEAPH
jgi:phage terminase Nu1 subunit (DNA packaging protein)